MQYRKRMNRLLMALAGAALLSVPFAAQTTPPPRAKSGLTAVEGIKVGHHTLTERPTGCTVILVDGDAVGGVSQRGGAPGTRETDLLDPLNMVDKVNAVVLAGGSAFGLEAATGTVKWLEEHNIGWAAGPSRVPIVPGAILFDLGVGGNPKIRPTADCGYKAAEAATAGPVRRRFGRRRRWRDRRQVRRTGTLDESRARHRVDHASRAVSSSRPSSPSTRSATSSIPRTEKSSPACATPTARSRTRARSCAPAAFAARRVPARTPRSASSPPTRS